MANNNLLIVVLLGGVAAAYYFFYYRKKITGRSDPFSIPETFGGIQQSFDGKYQFPTTDPFSVKANRIRAYASRKRLPKMKKARSV
jgi:hypothetical protein